MLPLDTAEALIEDMKLSRFSLSLFIIAALAIAFGRGTVFISSVVWGSVAVSASPLFVGIAAAMLLCGSAVSDRGELSVRLLSVSVLLFAGR